MSASGEQSVEEMMNRLKARFKAAGLDTNRSESFSENMVQVTFLDAEAFNLKKPNPTRTLRFKKENTATHSTQFGSNKIIKTL